MYIDRVVTNPGEKELQDTNKQRKKFLEMGNGGRKMSMNDMSYDPT